MKNREAIYRLVDKWIEAQRADSEVVRMQTRPGWVKKRMATINAVMKAYSAVENAVHNAAMKEKG